MQVWWTGDGVPLMATVEAMVDEAVHDFRAFVHSDCGGHGSRDACEKTGGGIVREDKACPSPNDAALLRWTAMCVLGTVVRYHQGDHRFWLRGTATQDTAREYLQMRQKLSPSLVSAGRLVQSAGFPLTARCDLIWPEYHEANDSTQYIHLNSTLVAPLDVEPVDNISNSRSVWIPPGEWQDAWTGESVTGPRTIHVMQPADRIPMWHKRGSLLLTDGTKGNLRLVSQDWSELVVEAFPAAGASSETRHVYEQEGSEHANDSHPTKVRLVSNGNGKVVIETSTSPIQRSWLVRLHLRSGERVRLDPESQAAVAGPVNHLAPRGCDASFFPLHGEGSLPSCRAGPVAEFRLVSSSAPQIVTLTYL